MIDASVITALCRAVDVLVLSFDLTGSGSPGAGEAWYFLLVVAE